MRVQNQDTNHPRLPYDEAKARVQRHGYVRMEGHTATNMEQLDELYNVILPAKDGGSYSAPADYEKALAEARKAEAAATTGMQEATRGKAASDKQVAELSAQVAELQKEVEALRNPPK